jgi:hypothetical protein
MWLTYQLYKKHAFGPAMLETAGQLFNKSHVTKDFGRYIRRFNVKLGAALLPF